MGHSWFTPSATLKILAVLSVLPVMMYSPVGLQARSYSSETVTLLDKLSLGVGVERKDAPNVSDYSPSFFIHCGFFRISAPNGSILVILGPNHKHSVFDFGQHEENKIQKRKTYHQRQKPRDPLGTMQQVEKVVVEKDNVRNKDVPLGLHLTAFTAPTCLESVERYSAFGPLSNLPSGSVGWMSQT